MTELPPAIVESPRSSRRPRPERANAIRKLIVVGLVIGTSFGCWKLLHPWWHSESYKQLEARQDKARENVGDAFDELFDDQLEANSTSIDLSARFEVADELGGGYDPAACGRGFDDAFSEAFGPDVVRVTTFGIMPPPETRLAITATIEATGQTYRLPLSHTSYDGIAVTADMTFLGRHLHVQLTPGTNIELEHVELGIPFRSTSAWDVAGEVMQGTCKQLGYALVEQWTKWKRPPLRLLDPVAECAQGYHCRDNGDALVATDRVTAATLYAKACELDDDEGACLRAADVEIGLAKGDDEHRARAHALLDAACVRSLAGACADAGRIALVPIDPGAVVSFQQRRDALAYYLRGCDLGDGDACASARELVTVYAIAAAGDPD